MTALGRAFLAVFPPADVVGAVDERLGPVRVLPAAAGLRWVRREQWHLTLRFCGRVPDGDALGGADADELTGLAAVPGLR
ncbi:MAG: 2'-5' RNA ligase family protein, partial [Phycisphaerales bacterium]